MMTRPPYQDSTLFHPQMIGDAPENCHTFPLPCCDDEDTCVCECCRCDCRYADTPETD